MSTRRTRIPGPHTGRDTRPVEWPRPFRRVVLRAEPLEDRSQASASALGPSFLPNLPPESLAALIGSASGAGGADAVTPPQSGPSLAPGAVGVARHELVLIDFDVPERDALARSFLSVPGAGGNASVEVVELHGGGVAEVTDVLRRYSGLDAVRLVSHGTAGALHLGTDWITSANLDGFAADFQGWSTSLNAGADLLLYGCGLAGDAAGRTLVTEVAALTGADVAASTDVTGAAALGGDWDLEYRTGSVQAVAAVAPLSQTGWEHTLGAGGLYLTTENDVNSAGVSGLSSWTQQQVLTVQDPNFALEPGTTDGTFSSFLDLRSFGVSDGRIDALHVVRQAVTVGTGANAVALLPGDVVLSLDKADTLIGQNTLRVDKDDVFAFRPAAPGDYGAGSFLMLLDKFGSLKDAKNIQGLALVETDTVVGDVTVRAGSILFSGEGGGREKDILLYAPDVAGATPTSGTVSVLIDGQDVGIDSKVVGLELVQTATTVGGRALAAGTLLFTLDGDDNKLGSNDAAATTFDVVALDVAQTTLGSGHAAATAAVLFQGADVGLHRGPESLRDISLGAPTPTPVAGADAYSTPAATPLSVPAASGLLANDADAGGGTLAAALATGPAHGTVVVAADGSFTYTPTPGYSGPDAFTYTVTNAAGGTATGTVALTIGTVNAAPVVTMPGPQTVAEDGTLVLSVATNNMFTVTDPDNGPGSGTLTFTVTHGTVSVVAVSGTFAVTGGADGSETVTITPGPGGASVALRYHPTPDYSGPALIYLTASDGAAATTRTTAVTVTPVNDAPTVTPVADPTVLEDTPAGPLVLIVGDVETPAGALAVTATSSNPALIPDANIVITGTGAVRNILAVPVAGASGTAVITVSVSDGTATTTESFTVTVLPVNDPPAAQDDSAFVQQGTSLAVAGPGVLGNDGDPDGDPLTAALVTGPAHGTLALNADGSFTYTPAPGFRGTDRFTYQAVDPSGAASAPATVTLWVYSSGGRPVATRDAYTATIGGQLVVPAATGVLANDTPASVTALSAELARGPRHGTLTLASDGSFVYTPDAGFAGIDSFRYRATDGGQSSGSVLVQLRVAPPDDATAAAFSFTIPAGTTLTVPGWGGVAGDDVDEDGGGRGDDDWAGVNFTAALRTGAAHGTVTMADDGSFSYTPDAGFSGTDTFTYLVTADRHFSGVVTVTVTVQPAAAPPTAPAAGPQPSPGEPAPVPAPPPEFAPAPATQPLPAPASVLGTDLTFVTVTTVPGPPVETSPVTTSTVTPTQREREAGRAYASGNDAANPAPGPAAPQPAEGNPGPVAVAPPAQPAPAAATQPPTPVLPVAPSGPTSVPAAVAATVVNALEATDPVFAALDQASHELLGETQTQAATDAVVATGAVATAGYVLLNTRAVYWFLSALLARPAVWRRFDPLDVIYAWEHGQPDGPETPTADDDESLQSIAG